MDASMRLFDRAGCSCTHTHVFCSRLLVSTVVSVPLFILESDAQTRTSSTCQVRRLARLPQPSALETMQALFHHSPPRGSSLSPLWNRRISSTAAPSSSSPRAHACPPRCPSLLDAIVIDCIVAELKRYDNMMFSKLLATKKKLKSSTSRKVQRDSDDSAVL